MNISDVKSSLSAIGEIYRGEILTTNYYATNKLVSWNGYNPGINKRSYLEEFCEILDKRQYSFLLDDNSFLQFYFEFDENGSLEKARLAYYPHPGNHILDETFNNEILNYVDQEIGGVEEISSYIESSGALSFTNTSHLRVDYDQNVSVHSKCHLQFGAITNLRITSYYLLNPFIFTDFIYKSFFSTQYATISQSTSYSTKFDIFKGKGMRINQDSLDTVLSLVDIHS